MIFSFTYCTAKNSVMRGPIYQMHMKEVVLVQNDSVG